MQLQKACGGQDMALLRLLVRFAAELCNASVLEAASLHHLFKSMLAIAQSAESEGRAGEAARHCMCHAVLAALPFAAAGLKVADRAILDHKAEPVVRGQPPAPAHSPPGHVPSPRRGGCRFARDRLVLGKRLR